MERFVAVLTFILAIIALCQQIQNVKKIKELKAENWTLGAEARWAKRERDAIENELRGFIKENKLLKEELEKYKNNLSEEKTDKKKKVEESAEKPVKKTRKKKGE